MAYTEKERHEIERVSDSDFPRGKEAIEQEVFTREDEARVIRKLDKRLLPIVFFFYMLAVLDRSNLGNARIAGMEDTIDLGGYNYNWLGTVFYIAYICSQWLLMGWKQFPPHMWCTGVVIFWGFVASIQAACTNWGGLMACRFFLGVAEAAYGPGVPLYLTYFYPRDKVGFRQGIFISAAALANVYGGVLAYGITQINGALAPWRILFLIEGLPTIAFAAIAWFGLPDSIDKAKFLTEREQQIAFQYTARNQKVDLDRKKGIQIKEVFAGIKDPMSWIPGMMYFSCNVSFASLPLFVPTIISEMGTFGAAQSNGLSAAPYAAAFLYIIGICFISDHFKMRGPFCCLSALIATVGFIINATTSTTGPRYFSLFLSVQIFASVALLLAWVANIHATESRRAGGYTVLATLGQFGPLLGTNVFPESEAPLYRKGTWISAAFCLLVAVLSVVLSLWLIRENKKLDREGIPEVEGFEETSATREGGRQERHRFIW